MQRLFLVLAVAVSFAIGSISYISGSAPEWIVLKSSVGLFAVGLMSWVVSAVTVETSGETVDGAKGTRVDVTLESAAPAGSGKDNRAEKRSTGR